MFLHVQESLIADEKMTNDRKFLFHFHNILKHVKLSHKSISFFKLFHLGYLKFSFLTLFEYQTDFVAYEMR